MAQRPKPPSLGSYFPYVAIVMAAAYLLITLILKLNKG